ncbi:hypothetical protein FQN54_006214 [Arachnomyces sp. PD_36]|nr:hypothetical protein FQN54_006214 [Arachnomyces sp. PD_36]
MPPTMPPAAGEESSSTDFENNPLLRNDNPLVSPLEQEVLDEYTKLLENMHKLSASITDLADQPAAITLDGLRLLERKTATVCTLLKASVYSIVLQQQIYNGGEEGQGGAGGEGEEQYHTHGGKG